MIAPTNDKASFKQPRLLVVETDETQWMMIRQALMRTFADAVLVRAASRKQLQQLSKEWEEFEWEIPKLILLNTDSSSHAEGLQLLADLKSLADPLYQIPVIIFICLEAQAFIAETYQRGCSACVLQPPTSLEWIECLKELRHYWWEIITPPPLHIGIP